MTTPNLRIEFFDDLQNVNVLITTFALIGGAFQAAELDAKSAIHQACTLAADM